MSDIDSSRSDVEAAFDKLSEAVPDAGPPPELPAEPVTDPSPVESLPAEPVTETATEKADRLRDERGKFTKAKTPLPSATKAPTPGVQDKTQAPAAAAAPSATPTPTPAVVTPSLRAPASWTPVEREAWSKVPPELQKRVVEREKEIATTLQETASVRQQWGALQQVAAPYMGMIQAEGADLHGTVGSLLQTAAALRTAPPAHKAQLVASIVRQFLPGQDGLQLLDSALAGQPMPQTQSASFDPAQVAQQVEQRLMQRFTQQRSQASEAKAMSDLQAFESSNPEFLSDVRDDMADIMETRAKRGLQTTFEDAYNLACKLHPEISSVLEQRKAASQANANNASTQRALRASSSVRGQPTTVVTTDGPQSRRDEVAAVFDKLSGR